jgi:hypothetical protein
MGVTDHVWNVPDVVAIIEAVEPITAKRLPYKSGLQLELSRFLLSSAVPGYEMVGRWLHRGLPHHITMHLVGLDLP